VLGVPVASPSRLLGRHATASPHASAAASSPVVTNVVPVAAPTPTSPSVSVGDPITYRSAKDAAILMAAVVVGGLAVTIAVAWLVYRRNVNARRRYVYVAPPERAAGARTGRVDHPTA
jgi:ABC-type Fe3+ transport system permease subunit